MLASNMSHAAENRFLVEVVKAANYRLREPVNTDEVARRLGLDDDQAYQCLMLWSDEGRLDVMDGFASITVAALNDVDEWEARILFDQIRKAYLQNPSDFVRVDHDEGASINTNRPLERLVVEGILEDDSAGRWRITEKAKGLFHGASTGQSNAGSQNHYHLGSTVNVLNSDNCAVAIGPHATASSNTGLTQDQF